MTAGDDDESDDNNYINNNNNVQQQQQQQTVKKIKITSIYPAKQHSTPELPNKNWAQDQYDVTVVAQLTQHGSQHVSYVLQHIDIQHRIQLTSHNMQPLC